MKTRSIALSGIAAALVALVLTVGAYFSDFLDVFALLVVPFFLSIPLYENSVKGSLLAYAVGGVVALVLSSFSVLNYIFILYFPFFGIYPTVRYVVTMKKKDKLLFKALSAVWFSAVMTFSLFYYTVICKFPLEMIFPIPEYMYYLLIAGASLFAYFLVDEIVFSAQIIIFRLLGRILKRNQN